MKKVLFLAILVVLLMQTTSWGLEYEQLQKLDGFDMISKRVNEAIYIYGIPTIIIDYGVKNGKKESDARFGKSLVIPLTDDDWNLVYFGNIDFNEQAYAGFVKDHQNSPDMWVHPTYRPAKSANFSIMSLYAVGNKPLVSFDKNSKKLIETPAENLLQAHMIGSVNWEFPEALAQDEIIKKYGEPDERAKNYRNQNVLRYWVKYTIKEYYSAPLALYAVDFEFNNDGKIGSYSIYSTNIYFVETKFKEIFAQWQKDNPKSQNN